MRSLTLALLCLFQLTAWAETLTVERIFADPDLSGPRLRSPQFTPKGELLVYLRGKEEDKNRLDLWAFDIAAKRHRLLVDSRVFTGTERLSAEEEARRERQRTASLSGILEYELSFDGSLLLVPLNGDIYVYNLRSKDGKARQLTRTDAYETDVRFSPRASYVSFIRDQDLFVVDLTTGAERALTKDGEGLISNGMAEFVAQEEMDRDTGYWWAPDESHIAFTRVDESPVPEVERIEVHADQARIVRQRYPAAGSNNADVELRLVNVSSGEIRSLEPQRAADTYLARVNWAPDSRHVVAQRQSRDQRRLDLIKIDTRNAKSSVLFTEESEHWVQLHRDLRFLKKQPAFVWSSRRSGFKHLYLYDMEGQLLRQLTDGPWMVVGESSENGIVGIDEARGRVYFLANYSAVTERHLYSVPLSGRAVRDPARHTKEKGWHDVVLSPDGQSFLDAWSSNEQPQTAAIKRFDSRSTTWVARNELDSTHPYGAFLDHHVQEELGTLKAVDGQTLHYRLLRPSTLEANRRYPVVIDTYGGPHSQFVKNDWMGGTRAAQGYFRQVLAQNGFVVFALDNRGSGFRGNTFEHVIAGKMGQPEVDDQLAGIEFLKRLDFVDPERIGIMGWSYGGYMTLMAMTHPARAFKAGVAGAPVSDWRLYDTHYTERYLGTPQHAPAAYEASAVLPRLDRLHGSLLLVHGMADDNVLFTHSTSVMKRLQDQGRSFELMTYPGGKHGLIRMPDTGKHYYELVLKFFKERL